VSNTYCVVFLFFFVLLPVSLDCPVLIAPLVFSNVYLRFFVSSFFSVVTDEEKQKHNTICVGHYYTQTNTNSVTYIIPIDKTEIKIRKYPHMLVI
jgi:hypothetical protein